MAVRKCAYIGLNAKVYEWLTGRLLQEKATMFAVEMGHKDFTAPQVSDPPQHKCLCSER